MPQFFMSKTSSQVLQQKGNIDLISNNAIASTENVKDGNEELRKAIQRNASIRFTNSRVLKDTPSPNMEISFYFTEYTSCSFCW